MVDITRIPKGTASSKTLGSSLTLASVQVLSGQALVVGVAYDAGLGAPVVTWGNRELSQIAVRAQSGAATALFLLRHINNTATRTITCTWAGAILARAMFATAIDGVKIQDVSAGASEASTADPTTGAAATSTQPDTIQISALGSQGPVSDTVGTVGEGHTSGQRDGTVGAPAISNITIHETFEILSATGDVRASKTGATARTWANVIMAVKQSLRNRQGITPADLLNAEVIFDTAGGDFENAVFKYNSATDQWEVYETATPGVLRAVSNLASGFWESV